MLSTDPLWYKDAIVYQLHARAFCDTTGDGTGDFPGLTQKLDYLQDLGVTAIWLLPFYPSPLKDDGYDIANYTAIHPAYGTVREFKSFLDDAHRRGMRVITELVLNHTSDQHPWFQRARRSPPGSPERDFYVWSDTPAKFQEVRIIFSDFETSNWAWDPIAGAHYWHRFYSHQPDLNYDNPEVRNEMFAVVDFWMGLGVDGMRLDAVPYLYKREGTNCENLPETHAFLRELRQHIDSKYPNRMLLAEANQWPEDAVAYFGNGDESNMAFHFPLMPRMFMAMHMEDRYPIVDILNQTPAIPETSQWAVFLRNHDELTLEMVTDEERDYMYRTFARDSRARINAGIRRRLAPLLDNSRRRIELMNGLLFSLPGTPVIYYGDEIGMGDNIYLGDRNSVRTPMQWSSDRNAGFSDANPQRMYLPVIVDPEYHYEAINVEAQQNNPSSLLWWMKRWIALRKQYRVFGRGTIEFLQPRNHKVLAFLRQFENERILVVANLSRFAQYVELDLSKFVGCSVVELSGRTSFPMISDHPYLLTLAPYAFYWLLLDPTPSHVLARATGTTPEIPTLPVQPTWSEILQVPGKAALERRLSQYLHDHHSLGPDLRRVRTINIMEAIPMQCDTDAVCWILVRVDFLDAEPETHVLTLALATGETAVGIESRTPHHIVARLEGETPAVLYDALINPAFCRGVLDLILKQGGLGSSSGELTTSMMPSATAEIPAVTSLEPDLRLAVQGRPVVVFGNQMVLKFCRKTEAGINPDLEMGRFLARAKGQTNVPPVLGWIEYRRWRDEQPMTLGILRRYLEGVEDAWQYTVDAVGQFFDRALATKTQPELISLNIDTLLEAVDRALPQLASDTVDTYLDLAHGLGGHTAELHLALASDPDDPAFAPEPFSVHYQRSIYQSMRTQTIRALAELRQRVGELPPDLQPEVRTLLEREDEIMQRYRRLLKDRMNATRIRCHGDYHLRNVLYTGKDFAIADFDGELLTGLSERRIKHSPLHDVTSMLRSFQYAVYSVLYGYSSRAGSTLAAVRPQDVQQLEPWARLWCLWVSAAFLKSYRQRAGDALFLPKTREEFRILCDAFSLSKASQQIIYELNHRPDWLAIPVRGLLQLLPPRTST
jgi:maltose alpha-D-glucosyltransferase/alpha-amylase